MQSIGCRSARTEEMRVPLPLIRAIPPHLYLGTATGWIYESRDGGGQWKRLAWIGEPK